jgi:glycine N-methyltransferase
MECFHDYRKALKNFEQCVKPGGMLLIDHRNYDYIIDKGATPAKSIYYNVRINNLARY